MFAAFTRGLPLVAALGFMLINAAHGAAIGLSGSPAESVDERSYPWSSLGKLYNESGHSCSGAVIARDKILTAAHCLYNFRSRHYIAAESLHFLVGYRSGRYSAHARVASYQVGPGFDPLRYEQTSDSDWAVLTVTEPLSASIEPLRLRADAVPSGTKAVMAGYGQDRAFVLTADRNCELRDKISLGLVIHTCRGNFGSSGAPILVSAGNGREMEIAGVQIAAMQGGGVEQMVAVPAQTILLREQPPRDVKPVRAYVMPVLISPDGCAANASADTPVTLAAIQARMDWHQPAADAPVSEAPATDPSIIEVRAPKEPDWGVATTNVAWVVAEPFGIAYP